MKQPTPHKKQPATYRQQGHTTMTNKKQPSFSWLAAAQPPRLLNGLWILLFAGFVLWVTLLNNRYLLWELHDQSLFLADKTYLYECLNMVGGLTIYVSTFLNQYFLYPTLGALLYLAWLLVIALVTAKAFRLKGWAFPLAFIPSLLLVLSLIQNGYMIYLLKLEGFAYVSIIGTLVAVLAPLLAQRIRNLAGSMVFALAYLMVAYPLAGAYGLVGGLLLVIYWVTDAVVNKRLNRLLPAAVSLLSILAIPQAFYLWGYDAIMRNHLYISTLPDYVWNQEEKVLWLPYVLLLVFFLTATLIGTVHPSFKKAPRCWHLTPLILVLLCTLLVVKKQYRDTNFTTQIAMMEASEKQAWHKVLRLLKESDEEPTRLMVMHKNLALMKLGKQGDTQYTYPDGNKPMNYHRRLVEVQLAGPFFYFHYGKSNYCYKWCMEGMVEYGMSPSYLKYFVLSSLVNGEPKLADKYNKILAASPTHRNWAKAHQPLIDDTALVASHPFFAKILPLTHYDNYLDGDYGLLEHYIRRDFAHMIGGPPEMVEQCILFNMQLKDIERFWPAFMFWMQKGQPLRTHMQEAALLFHHLERKFQLDVSRFDPAVLKRFQDFIAMVNQYANYPESAVVDLYKQRFGDTYWFYYFFVQDHSNRDAKGEQKPYSS